FAAFAVSSIFAAGPTRIGSMSPACAASTAPVKAETSQGWATAVGIAPTLLHRSNNFSYFPVPVFALIFPPVNLCAQQSLSLVTADREQSRSAPRRAWAETRVENVATRVVKRRRKPAAASSRRLDQARR